MLSSPSVSSYMQVEPHLQPTLKAHARSRFQENGSTAWTARPQKAKTRNHLCCMRFSSTSCWCFRGWSGKWRWLDRLWEVVLVTMWKELTDPLPSVRNSTMAYRPYKFYLDHHGGAFGLWRCLCDRLCIVEVDFASTTRLSVELGTDRSWETYRLMGSEC
jgi:hypothetical protein